jgi:hypothetical protein
VRDRRPAQPELSLAVLRLVVPMSFGDLVEAGWVTIAATQVYTAYVPGFSHGRTHQLIERFVVWLHEQREIDDWQRDVALAKIDEMRGACGGRPVGRRLVAEIGLRTVRSGRYDEAFARTVDPFLQPLVPQLMRVLWSHLEERLGPCSDPPVGSLDADRMIAAVYALLEPGGIEAYRDLFLMTSAFYRWLGEHGHLDPARANAIASRFAAASLSLVA